eukprot:CAMPEP_0172875378 /NCGR_PEP_ID=MMETSP1075-20121228/101456_1 /TAXON_ID=2916 /ORGANISM="Ceratium fusus, Strain PA161109" /LENGTH=48 /DNA_ID= /DNA_START= /DNA_END= /DNA_ORIENTATION=
MGAAAWYVMPDIAAPPTAWLNSERVMTPSWLRSSASNADWPCITIAPA